MVRTKQGFLENSVFYHPELNCSFLFHNWLIKILPSVQLASKDGKSHDDAMLRLAIL